jgi:hypothetical protein
VRGEAHGVVDVLLQGVKARASARRVRIRALKRHGRLGDGVVERRPQRLAVGDQRDEVRVPGVADKIGVMVVHGGQRTRPWRRPIAADARRRTAARSAGATLPGLETERAHLRVSLADQ